MEIPYPAILAVYNQASSWQWKTIWSTPPFLGHLIGDRGLNLLGNDGVCAEGRSDACGTSLVNPLGGDALRWDKW